MKPCRACGGTERYANDGKCIACVRARVAAWRLAKPERVALHAGAKKAWATDNPDYWLKRKYGITGAQREAMWAAQSGLCAICQDPMKTGAGGSAVDHCHTTKKVRALLCQGCNVGIGHFRESRAHLAAASAYLAFHQSQH